MKTIKKLIPGMLLGIVLTGVAVYMCMPTMMIRIQESPMGLKKTVQALCDKAEKHGGGDLGRMMGGTIARVMGGSVSKDQQQVLSILEQ